MRLPADALTLFNVYGEEKLDISIILNGEVINDNVDPGLSLLEFVRTHGMKSVKCGCDTSNCGACTVLLDGMPILSCSYLAVRASGHEVTTLEGVKSKALAIGRFIADQGAEQCGFCNPGYILNTIALLRDNSDPTDEEIRSYLAGNLCRCSGYDGQLRGIRAYLDSLK